VTRARRGEGVSRGARRAAGFVLRAAGPRAVRSGARAIDVGMMLRAMTLARHAARRGEVPVGAVVYRGREVLTEHANDRETTGDPTGHAELVAMREAGRLRGAWRLSDCSLAVTLEPCAMCAGAIVNARMGRVFFGAHDPKAGACGSLWTIPADGRLNHRPPIVAGILARPCGRQLTAFFARRRQERSASRGAASRGAASSRGGTAPRDASTSPSPSASRSTTVA
jgi:tRNA(adenine34) deaminase